MPQPTSFRSPDELTHRRRERALAIAKAGSFETALANDTLSNNVDLTLSEALVLGLLRQNVTRFLCVLGHGSTEIGEVLRLYQEAGAVSVHGLHSEIEASHAAAALNWTTGEKAAVVTSIGPGALQALAASLLPASNGLGVYYLLGDETSEDEGFNMQQIPRHEQGLFLRLFSTMGAAYSLHTPGALSTALKRGLVTTAHPHRPAPFYLLMPMNTQAAALAGFNLDELPCGTPAPLGASPDDHAYGEAAQALRDAERVVIRAGGGAHAAGSELLELAELADGVIVTSPLISGVVPYAHPRNMTVGGSKGSICGNFAMEEADLLVVVGSRSVCQSDSSRTGYPKAKRVIHINTDLHDAWHYNRSLALLGDAAPTLAKLNDALRRLAAPDKPTPSAWLTACTEQKTAWDAFKKARYDRPTLFDEKRQCDLLTQPAAVKQVCEAARAKEAVCFFDAGDVQANGFQIVEDAAPGRCFTDTGASYMGFAVSALLATGLARQPFYGVACTGDGSFMMNPQILVDGVEHGARGVIVLFDNRRMAAISGLQKAQYGHDFATDDSVVVDYVALAGAVKGVKALYGGTTSAELTAALQAAFSYEGLSLIHLPVYSGDDPLGGLDAWGRWNVGNWVDDTQALRHKIGL